MPTTTIVSRNATDIDIDVPTIILLGPTGAGKSTLLNAVFSFSLSSPLHARTRAGGEPCTMHTRDYGPTPLAPLRLIDTRGFERAELATLQSETLQYVRRRGNVDLAWYLIDERWQQDDAQFVHSLIKLLPTVCVLSKCDTDMRREIDTITGMSAAQMTEQAINEDIPNVPVFRCGISSDDNSNENNDHDIQTKVPEQCRNGHPSEYFSENRRCRTWTCEYSGCDETGSFLTISTRQSSGVNHLVTATLSASPLMRVRARLQSQLRNLPNQRRVAKEVMENAFWRAFQNNNSNSLSAARDIQYSILRAYDNNNSQRYTIPDDVMKAIILDVNDRGQYMMSTSTIRSLREHWVARSTGLATGTEKFRMGLMLQVTAMGIIGALEKSLFLIGDDEKCGALSQQEYVREVVAQCKRKDVNQMRKERIVMEAEMKIVLEYLEHRVNESVGEIQNCIVAERSHQP